MPVLPIQIDKTKPPLISGYRKVIIAGAAMILLGVVAWQWPGLLQEGQFGDLLKWILIGFFGGNALKGGAIALAGRGTKTAPKVPALPGPDELLGDLPLSVHDGEMAAGHPEE